MKLLDKKHKEQERMRKELNKSKSLLKASKDDLREMGKGGKIFAFPFANFKAIQSEKRVYTTQETLPYKKLYSDGLMHVDGKEYNRIIAFEDVNYRMAYDFDQEDIQNCLAEIFNSFNKDTHLQLVYINQMGRYKHLKKAIEIEQRDDCVSDIRHEFSNVLLKKALEGNNGLQKIKLLVISVEADNDEQARAKLNRLELGVINKLKKIRSAAYVLNGEARMELTYNYLNIGYKFNLEPHKANGTINSKTVIAPAYFDFKADNHFKINEQYCRSLYLKIDASELNDKMFSELFNLPENIVISLHVKPMEATHTIKLLKRKFSDVQKMIIDEQKRAISSGYDMDILPSDLSAYKRELQEQLASVQERDQKLFDVSIVCTVQAASKEELENLIAALRQIVGAYQCDWYTLRWQQEDGLLSSLPFGVNKLDISRYLTTEALLGFMPFDTAEMMQDSKTSLYYGLNATSGNLIMADRRLLTNPNGLILGVPGGGKSFFAKLEIVNNYFVSDDEVIICDPEGEYGELVKHMGGEEILISADSKYHINPLDIMNVTDPTMSARLKSEGIDPVRDKADFLLRLFQTILGGAELTAIDKSIIDRCVQIIYARYLRDPKPSNMPILGDLHLVLREQPEAEARRLATELELYVSGSLNFFNHRTNVELSKRIVDFNLVKLQRNLWLLGMLVVQEYVWSKVARNRNTHRRTWFYEDEFHLFLKNPQTAAYAIEIWKRFRKWGGIPTGITQNVGDMLASSEIENVFNNTPFIIMLNQQGNDREILAEKLGISEYQVDFVKNSEPGEGLFFYQQKIIPFKNKFPKKTKLYSLLTTRPDERAEAENVERT